MFEQIDDPEVAGRKTWKERLTEGAIILAVVAVVIGIILYALEMG
jgi:cytochrome c-type biogenesis protein CcmE